MARPSTYTDEIATLILNRIGDGQSLRQICRDDDLPHRETVRRWLRDMPEFRGLFAVANHERADAFLEDIVEIADDARNDWMTREDGSKALDSEHVQRSKLRIDARKWAMSKLAPRKYGEKLAIGGDEDAPPIKLDNMGLARKICFLLTKADIEAKGSE